MATVSVVIRKSERKVDGTWRVYIQVGHKGKTDWIKTDVFVDKSQVNRNHDIKDQDVLDDFHDRLKSLRKLIGSMDDLEFITVKELKSRLDSDGNNNCPVKVNFIQFIKDLKNEKITARKTGSIANYNTVLYCRFRRS